ncbi:MAG: FAD/NAD(P)-binding protein [Alphaproteobacteria bacterium]|nr:FAD/NAD(P)-binding protein [Alphaproteobacteria bacterium]
MTAAALDLWRPVPMPVVSKVQETADTVTIELDARDSPVRFAPGQFTMLYAFGHGEVPISISGDPAHPERLVHTIRAVGRVTNPLVAVEPGQVLGVRGPFGTGWPVHDAEDGEVVVVAGGIGLAPVRPVFHALAAHRERYERVWVLVGARTPADLLYREELERFAGAHGFDLRLTVDHADDTWDGPVGVVTRLLEAADFDPSRATLMTCGPEIMMRFVVREALRQGVPAEKIWLSMERNMKCAIGLCGHCQWGADFLCRTGPVMRWDHAMHRFDVGGL